MNCFIINLSQDVERKEIITGEMKKNDINFSFIEAVDGRILSKEDIEKYYNENKAVELFNHKLSTGEIGCALSHIKIYEKMVFEEIPNALIMEDDVFIIDRKINEVIKNLEKIYPADIPVIILLGHIKKYISNKNDMIIDEKYSLYDSYRGSGAFGYFITKSAAKILIENIFPVYVVADKWEYIQEKFFPVKILIPDCIGLSEQNSFSTITSFGDRVRNKSTKFNIKYYAKKHVRKVIFTLFERPFIKIKKAQKSEKN
jgi:glycosyl transferase family 25